MRWADSLSTLPCFSLPWIFFQISSKSSQEAWSPASLLGFLCFLFAAFLEHLFLISLPFRDMGIGHLGELREWKKLHLCLKESGLDCGEDSLHWTVPARAGKGLSPFWESLWAYITCVPSQDLVLFCSLGRLWLCLYLLLMSCCNKSS